MDNTELRADCLHNWRYRQFHLSLATSCRHTLSFSRTEEGCPGLSSAAHNIRGTRRLAKKLLSSNLTQWLSKSKDKTTWIVNGEFTHAVVAVAKLGVELHILSSKPFCKYIHIFRNNPQRD